MKMRPPAECAHCGASIPPSAKACPSCGADERTGWRETSIYDGLELPDRAFDDDAAPRAPLPRRHINGIAWYWWCFAVGFIFAAILFVLSLL